MTSAYTDNQGWTVCGIMLEFINTFYSVQMSSITSLVMLISSMAIAISVKHVPYLLYYMPGHLPFRYGLPIWR